MVYFRLEVAREYLNQEQMEVAKVSNLMEEAIEYFEEVVKE
jgi:hypothetical protein